MAFGNAQAQGFNNPSIIVVNEVVIEGSKGKLLVYSGSPAAGNLIVSAAGSSGTDGEGNSFSEGLEVQNGGSILVVGTGQLIVGPSGGQQVILEISSGAGIAMFPTGAAVESAPANLSTEVVGSGNLQVVELFMGSAKSVGRGDQVFVELQSSTKDGTSGAAGGNLVYETAGGAQTAYLEWGLNGLIGQSSYAGDNNDYALLRAKVSPSGNITVNQTGFTQQVMPTLELGVGTYTLRGQIHYSPNQAAGFAMFELDGGTAAASMGIDFDEIALGSPSGLGNSLNIFGFASAFSGSTFGAADRLCKFSGNLSVTVAGSLALFAACGTAATDTYSIKQFGTFLELLPDA
jgi:hypothetical protein